MTPDQSGQVRWYECIQTKSRRTQKKQNQFNMASTTTRISNIYFTLNRHTLFTNAKSNGPPVWPRVIFDDR